MARYSRRVLSPGRSRVRTTGAKAPSVGGGPGPSGKPVESAPADGGTSNITAKDPASADIYEPQGDDSTGLDNPVGRENAPDAGDLRPNDACEPDATRACIGDDACTGRQACGLDGVWGTCACGARGSFDVKEDSGVAATSNTPGADAGLGSEENANQTPADSPARRDSPSECRNTASAGVEPLAIDGATWVYTYSDVDASFCKMPTTHCLSAPKGSVCLYGVAADAGTTYECSGATVSMRMATVDEVGTARPWDAASLGIAGVRFVLEGNDGPDVRVLLTQTDTPPGVMFVHGGSTSALQIDGATHTLTFEQFELPSWTIAEYPEYTSARLNPSDLYALHFQVVTVPGLSQDYSFCVSRLEWLDVAGAIIDTAETGLEEPDGG